MSRLAGLSQLRHVELLERAQALVPAGWPEKSGQGALLIRMAGMSREQLMQVIASGQVPGRVRGQLQVAPPVFAGQRGGNFKLPPESMRGARL